MIDEPRPSVLAQSFYHQPEAKTGKMRSWCGTGVNPGGSFFFSLKLRRREIPDSASQAKHKAVR